MPGFTSTVAEPIISSVESTASLGVITTEQGPLPLQSVSISARIDQLVAEVKVKQGYVNPHADAIEATYIFPLPDRAAVTRFQARLGERLIEGIIKERGAARQEYDRAIAQGHRAAIAEEERPNVFTMRVGNIMPGETAEIELTLCLPLAYESGEATLRFPLVVAPRYIPGKPLEDFSVGLGIARDTDAVPDASRITPPILLPGYPYPVKLDIQMQIPVGTGKPESNLPLEPIATNGTHSTWQVRPGQKLDRDYILRFMAAGAAVSSQLIIAPDTDDPTQGTMSLTLIPPLPSGKAQPKPRRIVFVLDRSVSMAGWKIIAARRAIGRMIDTLSPHDHFIVLAFDSSFEKFPPANENGGWYSGNDMQRYRAIEALASVHEQGGTEMARPLSEAVKLLQEKPATEDRILVLVTDGQVANEDQILKALQPHLNGLRIFTVGIDMAVNEGFLRRLAQLGGGEAELVESEERLDAVMQRFHRRIAAPVLRDLKLHAEGISLESGTLVPEHLPDLFAEAPLIIQARCTLPTTGKIFLSGSDDARKPWKQELSPRIQSGPVLRPCWARAQVRAMEDIYATGRNATPQMNERIVQHSIKYQVLSRFTAYLAVDYSALVNETGAPRAIVQSVEYPAGWDRSQEMCERPVSLTVSDAYAEAFAEYDHHPVRPEISPLRRCSVDKFRVTKSILGFSAAGMPDLTAFKDRAKAMVLAFEKELMVDTDLASNKLIQELEKLIADMDSFDAQLSDTVTLRKLLEELKKSMQPGSPVKPWKEDALNALRGFAMLPLVPSKGKRWLSFWK